MGDYCKIKTNYMIKNLNVLQVIESKVKTEKGIISVSFVEGYWLEFIKYKGEVKERFRFLEENSYVREWYEELLNTCDVERKYVKFFNVNEVYLNLKERMERKSKNEGEMDNIVVFYGVVPKKKNDENLEIECEVGEGGEDEDKRKKIGVVGSRGIKDRKLVEGELEKIKKEFMLVSGGADGVDKIAEGYADEKGLEKIIIYPDYKHFGKNAPVIRNSEIINLSDYLVIFWDGKSRGTLDVIEKCKSRGKKYRLVDF